MPRPAQIFLPSDETLLKSGVVSRARRVLLPCLLFQLQPFPPGAFLGAEAVLAGQLEDISVEGRSAFWCASSKCGSLGSPSPPRGSRCRHGSGDACLLRGGRNDAASGIALKKCYQKIGSAPACMAWSLLFFFFSQGRNFISRNRRSESWRNSRPLAATAACCRCLRSACERLPGYLRPARPPPGGEENPAISVWEM